MARTRTLDQLIATVRQRTNLENSSFVTDGEIRDFLNEEWGELHSRLTSAEGQPHFVSITTIPVLQGTSLYSLPADFWRLLRLTAEIDGIRRDMDPFQEAEAADLQNTQNFDALWTRGPRYRLQADNIEILPVNRSFTMTMGYIGACPVLVGGADTVDGFNGWEAVIIAGACALVREKEETDPAFFERRKDRLYVLIDAWASKRDASKPERVTDVTGGLAMGLSDRDLW